jgi:hypothetical protein
MRKTIPVGSSNQSPKSPIILDKSPQPNFHRPKEVLGLRLSALVLLGCGGLLPATVGQAQPRESMAGEEAARELKQSIEAEPYNLEYGPVRFRTQAQARLGYTDNLFYTDTDRKEDLLVNPEVDLAALYPVTELNTLRLSLGIGYEWYLKNHSVNSDAPLINPGSELAFNVFVGDFVIKLHENFSYQQSLFFNSFPGDNVRFFNFNDVGQFTRWDNLAGFNVDWDLNRVVLSAGYDHENFSSSTTQFEYLDRASELFNASAAFQLGDKVKAGVEGQGSWNRYDQETVLQNNWRGRGGPFAEATLQQGITVRGGGGFDTAQFDSSALDNSEFKSYYAYGRIRQETRLFAHSITAGRENLLGDNANNLRTTYVRYAIDSPAIHHFDLGASFSVNFAKEFGGTFEENYTYYLVNARVGYQFHKYWRTGLGYEIALKDSELALRDFHRNQVTWDLTFIF